VPNTFSRDQTSVNFIERSTGLFHARCRYLFLLLATSAIFGFVLDIADAQTSIIVDYTFDTPGQCKSTTGSWATFEEAAEAEWQVCLSENPNDKCYSFTDECSPSGALSRGGQSACRVYFQGAPAWSILANASLSTSGKFWTLLPPQPEGAQKIVQRTPSTRRLEMYTRSRGTPPMLD